MKKKRFPWCLIGRDMTVTRVGFVTLRFLLVVGSDRSNCVLLMAVISHFLLLSFLCGYNSDIPFSVASFRCGSDKGILYYCSIEW